MPEPDLDTVCLPPTCCLLVPCAAAGKPVNTLYIAKKMKLKREMYFAILLDRKTAGPIMIGCRWGSRGF